VPQYFTRRWNPLSKLLLYGAPLLLAGAAWGAGKVVRSPFVTGVNDPPLQPVPFSHEQHVGRLKLDCRYCHTSVEESSFAGIPSTEICMQCHSHVWTGLQALEPVRSSQQTSIPLAWIRVHNLADFAYFDHSIHVKKGVGCVTCHGRVDRMPQVWKTQTLYMEWCLDCHRRPEEYVRPREEVFNLAWQPPATRREWTELAERLKLDPAPSNQRELGHALLEKYRIERETSCSACHR
jgi:hypothetical protein